MILNQKEAIKEGENLEKVGIDLKQLQIKMGMSKEEFEKEREKILNKENRKDDNNK